MRLPKLVPGAGASALLALLLHALWLASCCRRPHCAILSQLLDPELMLLLALLLRSNLLQGAMVHLPKLVSEAAPSAAAWPPCARPLAGLLVQGAPLRHPKSVAGAGADAATGPPSLCPSNVLLGALVRLPKLVPGAVAIAAACPLLHTLWLASWCRGPHCAILNQLLELELMLILALLTFAPAACY